VNVLGWGELGKGPPRRALATLALLLLVTAVGSYGYFHPDEHFQVLEFAGYKLGRTQLAELPWEHRAEMRPWLQPALYVGIAKALSFASPTGFSLALVYRLLSAALFFGAFVRVARRMGEGLASVEAFRAHWLVCSMVSVIPYLAVRPSSESLTTSMFLFAVFPWLGPSAEQPKLSSVLLSGIFMGLSFEMRYQSAFFGVGLLAHMVFVRRVGLRALWAWCTGGVLSVGVGTLADVWGYGHWVCAPYRYLHQNLFQGVAASFGTEPFFAYLYLPIANVAAPTALLLLLGLGCFCVRAPRHALSLSSLVFFVGHSAIAHKEERFMFPLVPLATVALVPAFAQGLPDASGPARHAARLGAWLFARRRSLGAKCLYAANVAALALLALYPLNWRSQTRIYKFLEHERVGAFVYFEGDRPEWCPFYMSRPFRRVALKAPWCVGPELGDGPAYLLTQGRVDEAALGVRATWVFSDFPLARWPGGGAALQRARSVNGWLRDSVSPRVPTFAWLDLYRIEPSSCPAATNAPAQ
jgi:phosphatidylinositol glycan class B